jgi:4-amino-4-deoxy-L-arabinose transferase-like glycosyltransferase
LQRRRPGTLLRIGFGFFLGAAVLAKGPAAVLLAGGATLAWGAMSRQWRAPLRFLHPVIIVVFCATAIPWYVLCALRNPDFLRVFIWQHNFERYLTPIFEHRQPFWFFVPIFLAGILPWLPLLFTALADAIRTRRFATDMDSPAIFIACWSLFTLLFFSLSQSKLPGYILPAFPPAILLLAAQLARQVAQKTKTARAVIVSIGIVFPVLIAIGRAQLHTLYVSGIVLPENLGLGIRLVLLTGLAGGALVVTFAVYRKWNGAIGAIAGTVVVLLLVANRLILPALDLSISARPAAIGLIRSFSATSDDVAVFQLPRAYKYGLNYYFDKDLPEWTPEISQRYLFFGRGALKGLDQFPQLSNARTSNFFPATPDGKVYLLLNRAPIHFR